MIHGLIHLLGKPPKLSEENLLFDVTLTVKDNLEILGYPYIEEFLVGNTDISLDGDIKFLAKVIFTSRYVGEFLFRGECKIYMPEKEKKDEHYIACKPNETKAYYKESDGYIVSITPTNINTELNYAQHVEDLETFILSGVETPLINAKVSLFEAWIGLLALALFIQVFTLSTLRQLSEENQFIKGWMFVSWMSSDGTGIVKKVTLLVEAIGGLSAFTLLAIIPIYSVWNSYNLRYLIGVENDNYVFLVLSILLSMLISYYLLLTFIRQLNLSRSEKYIK